MFWDPAKTSLIMDTEAAVLLTSHRMSTSKKDSKTAGPWTSLGPAGALRVSRSARNKRV